MQGLKAKWSPAATTPQILFIALVSHILDRLKQTLEKKLKNEICSFWFQTAGGGWG